MTNELLVKLDTLFVNGAIAGMLSIVFNTFFFLMINKILNKYILKQNWKQKMIVKKVKSIIIYTLLAVSVISQITFTKDLTSTLLASGGLVAVVVGLASQEAGSSLVSGFMLLISRPFETGDTIILKEHNLRGTVKEIKLSYTVIETIEKNLLLVPNTIMSKAIIENLTQDTDFKTSYLYISIAYESNLKKAIQIIKEIIENHELFYDITTSNEEEKVVVHCMDYLDNGISLRAKVTTKNAVDGFKLMSDCRILIKEAFDQNSIVIPYPHMDVRMY